MQTETLGHMQACKGLLSPRVEAELTDGKLLGQAKFQTVGDLLIEDNLGGQNPSPPLLASVLIRGKRKVREIGRFKLRLGPATGLWYLTRQLGRPSDWVRFGAGFGGWMQRMPD